MDDELKLLLTKLLEKQDALSSEIKAVRDALSSEIKAVRDALLSEIKAVDARVEQLQRVTSANHFKVIGRIDQVASMLGDHMADTEAHSPTHRRRA